MITVPFTYKFTAGKTYARIKQEAIPKGTHGAVVSLPLIFEFSLSPEQFKLKSISNQFEVLSQQAAINIMHGPTPVGRCQLFPVHCQRTNSISYLPQFLAHDRFMINEPDYSSTTLGRLSDGSSEAPAFQSLYLKSYGNGNYDLTTTDFIAFSVYNKDGKHYSHPVVDSYSFENHLCTQIYTRYYRPHSIENSSYNGTKTVMDTFVPFLAIGYVSDQSGHSAASTNVAAISPLTADLLNIPRIPLNTLLTKVLSHDLDYLKNLLLSIKQLNLTVVFAGTGGTGINTICWLSELCSLFDISDLFYDIHVFEKDFVDFSNIFRFPLPLSMYTSISSPTLHKTELVKRQLKTLSNCVYFHDRFIETLDDIPSTLLNGTVAADNVVFYGAPSITNRNFLSSLGSFISATHANNTASLYINPIADDSLQVETYGLIQLNSFFINQISMAIGFLEILSTNQYHNQDFHFADYTFIADTKDKFKFDISTELTAIPIPEGN